MLEKVSENRLLYVIYISRKLSYLPNQNHNGYKAVRSRTRPIIDTENCIGFPVYIANVFQSKD